MIIATVHTDAHCGAPADIGTPGCATSNGRVYAVAKGDISLSLDLQTFDRSFALVGFGSAFNELPYAIAWPLDGFIRTGGDASTVDGNIYGADGARAAGSVHRTDAVFAWAGNAASRLLARNMD